jgi:hypothetical protein
MINYNTYLILDKIKNPADKMPAGDNFNFGIPLPPYITLNQAGG